MKKKLLVKGAIPNQNGRPDWRIQLTKQLNYHINDDENFKGHHKNGWEGAFTRNRLLPFNYLIVADNRFVRWDMAVNWSFPKSRLVSFPGLSKSVYANRLVIGQSLNVLQGYVYKGVDKQLELYTFADLNLAGRITEADEKVLGKFDVDLFPPD